MFAVVVVDVDDDGGGAGVGCGGCGVADVFGRERTSSCPADDDDDDLAFASELLLPSSTSDLLRPLVFMMCCSDSSIFFVNVSALYAISLAAVEAAADDVDAAESAMLIGVLVEATAVASDVLEARFLMMMLEEKATSSLMRCTVLAR